MTEQSDFHAAFEAFMALPYPDYPRWDTLRDWNSRLLELDGHIAGYATRVNKGRLDASAIPEIHSLVLQVGTLRRDLAEMNPEREEDVDLMNGYRVYVSALERLTRSLASLASKKSE